MCKLLHRPSKKDSRPLCKWAIARLELKFMICHWVPAAKSFTLHRLVLGLNLAQSILEFTIFCACKPPNNLFSPTFIHNCKSGYGKQEEFYLLKSSLDQELSCRSSPYENTFTKKNLCFIKCTLN